MLDCKTKPLLYLRIPSNGRTIKESDITTVKVNSSGNYGRRIRIFSLSLVALFIISADFSRQHASHFGWGFLPHLISLYIPFIAAPLIILDAFILQCRWHKTQVDKFSITWVVLGASMGLLAFYNMSGEASLDIRASQFWLAILPFYGYVLLARTREGFMRNYYLLPIFLLLLLSPFLGPIITLFFALPITVVFHFRKQLQV